MCLNVRSECCVSPLVITVGPEDHMLLSSVSQRHFIEALLCSALWDIYNSNTDSGGCNWRHGFYI